MHPPLPRRKVLCNCSDELVLLFLIFLLTSGSNGRSTQMMVLWPSCWLAYTWFIFFILLLSTCCVSSYKVVAF